MFGTNDKKATYAVRLSVRVTKIFILKNNFLQKYNDFATNERERETDRKTDTRTDG